MLISTSIKIFICMLTTNLILATGSVVNESSIMKPAIRDLSADVVMNKDSDLQLKVSWNATGVKDTIGVRINPLIDEVNNEKYCNERTCFEYGLYSHTTEVLLPKETMSMIEQEHRECSIELGCSYEIIVETSNLKLYQNLTYTIPDCVGEVCSCQHNYKLPNITINANVKSSTIFIYWNITSNFTMSPGINIESILIKVGKQNNPSLTWGGHYKNITIIHRPFYTKDGKAILTGSANVPLNDDVLGGRYLISGLVLDVRGCRGHVTKCVIEVPFSSKKNLIQSPNINYMTIASVVLLLFLILVIMLFFFRNMIKKAKRAQIIRDWRGYYHDPSKRVDPTEVNMEKNILYVEKEIIDARLRGDFLEVPHSCVTLGRQIGKGAFGRVYIARADNLCGKAGSQIVAVKQLKKGPTPEEVEEFYNEIETMKTVSYHENVVCLLACCTIKQPLLMIMEYVGCGDLLNYLRQVRAKHETRSIVVNGIIRSNNQISERINVSHQSNFGPTGKYLQLLHSSSISSSSDAYISQPDNNPALLRPSVTETEYTVLSYNPDLTSSSHSSLDYIVDHKELHNFATQIARGMLHLSERQITHRDLAARNILIDENKTLKISDFGLSRSGIYVQSHNKKVPLRWLSIEAIRDHLYSTKSDVWAYSVVLWEIGTLGGFPYPTVGNHELLSFLLSGQRLQRPENCSEKLYDLMLQCWSENVEERPGFDEIVMELERSNEKIYVDFSELSSDYVFPPTKEILQNNNGIQK